MAADSDAIVAEFEKRACEEFSIDISSLDDRKSLAIMSNKLKEFLLDLCSFDKLEPRVHSTLRAMGGFEDHFCRLDEKNKLRQQRDADVQRQRDAKKLERKFTSEVYRASRNFLSRSRAKVSTAAELHDSGDESNGAKDASYDSEDGTDDEDSDVSDSDEPITRKKSKKDCKAKRCVRVRKTQTKPTPRTTPKMTHTSRFVLRSLLLRGTSDVFDVVLTTTGRFEMHKCGSKTTSACPYVTQIRLGSEVGCITMVSCDHRSAEPCEDSTDMVYDSDDSDYDDTPFELSHVRDSLLEAIEEAEMDFHIASFYFDPDLSPEIVEHFDAPDKCLISCMMKEDNSSRTHATVVVSRYEFGFATDHELAVLPHAVSFVLSNETSCFARGPHLRKRERKHRSAPSAASVAVASNRASAGATPMASVKYHSACQLTLADLESMHFEFVRKYTSFCRLKGMAVYTDPSRTTFDGPTRYYIQYSTYCRPRQAQFRHGQFLDENVAKLVSCWLCEQSEALRMTTGAGRVFIEKLVPAALDPTDVGREVTIDTEGTITVDGQVRHAVWLKTPPRACSGRLQPMSSRRLRDHMSCADVVTLKDKNGSVHTFANPRMSTLPTLEEATEACVSACLTHQVTASSTPGEKTPLPTLPSLPPVGAAHGASVDDEWSFGELSDEEITEIVQNASRL